MIPRLLTFVLLLAALSMGQENWNGFNDTCRIDGWNGTELAFSKAFNLTRYEDIAVVVKCNDTSQAGFAGDSLHARYGYQLGYVLKNASGLRDTIYWPPDSGIILDTVDLTDTDSSWDHRTGFTGADGSVTDYLGQVDTSSVTGYATQVSWFVPKWAVSIRFFVHGLGKNRGTTPNVWIFDVKRRLRSVVTE